MTWPRQVECSKFYGAPGTGHTLLTLPYPMRLAWDQHVPITKITIHSKCAASAAKVLTQAKDHYGMDKLEDMGLTLFGGCFNNRTMRGGLALSMHAYACAIDFDPDRNPLRGKKPGPRLSKPDAERWWEFWEAEGWVSLGRSRNMDWMHVQAARL